MLKLTTLAPQATDTHTGTAIAEFDKAAPDGLAKEIVARLAAKCVINGHDNPDALTSIHTAVAAFVKGGAQPLAKIITSTLNDQQVILLPVGADQADAVIAVHGVIKAVIDADATGTAEVIDGIPPAEPVIKPADGFTAPVENAANVAKKMKKGFGAVKPSIAGANVAAAKSPGEAATLLAAIVPLDLDTFLDGDHEPMRPLVTRILAHFYPDVFAQYRAIKDQATPEAKRAAYEFALTAFRKFIGTDPAPTPDGK